MGFLAKRYLNVDRLFTISCILLHQEWIKRGQTHRALAIQDDSLKPNAQLLRLELS